MYFSDGLFLFCAICHSLMYLSYISSGQSSIIIIQLCLSYINILNKIHFNHIAHA